MTNVLKKLTIFTLGAAISLFAAAKTEEQRAAIIERIKPHGEVCVEGDTSCATAAAPVSSGPRSGEDVYNGACVACHSSGAGGAPKLGDAAAWADRIAKGQDALYQSGLNGVAGGSMIARGGCMTCSDEEIFAAVDYMVENSQ
jgi:cytochrome c5